MHSRYVRSKEEEDVIFMTNGYCHDWLEITVSMYPYINRLKCNINPPKDKRFLNGRVNKR